MEEASVSVRLNPFKGLAGPEGTPVPWSPYGRILQERPVFTLDPLFHAGCYYVQDSSAMFVGYLFRKLLTGCTPLRGSQPPETSGCAGPLPLPSAAGPSLLRSCPEGKVPPNRGLQGFEDKPACWLRFPEAAAVSTTPATADSAAPASLPSVVFWSQNWRKGGLQPRRNEIVREQCFYNQNWCGCEFSKRQTL